MSTHRNTGSTPLRASRIARVVTALGFAVMVGGTSTMMACSDAPSAPIAIDNTAAAYHKQSSPDIGTVLGSPVRVNALLRDVPLQSSQTRSWVIQSAVGGELKWDELGLKVTVPPGAFSAREMTFTVTALKGAVIAYDFGPDGSRFNVPLQFSQSLRGTNYLKGIDPREKDKILRAKGSGGAGVLLRGGYFRHASQISATTNIATVDELLPVEMDLKTWRVKFKVTHFSGYMVSTD